MHPVTAPQSGAGIAWQDFGAYCFFEEVGGVIAVHVIEGEAELDEFMVTVVLTRTQRSVIRNIPLHVLRTCSCFAHDL